MNRSDFDNILLNQIEIPFDEAYKQITKVTKICGFLNLGGYDSTETLVKPTKSTNKGRAEIKLIEPNNTYSFYLKKDEDGNIPYSNKRSWFGVHDKYLIKNIGRGCAYVFEKQTTKHK
jgi:hypothetical protein